MQNLRDKLLKAGLVTEKQVEKALTDHKRSPKPPRPQPRAQSPEEAQRAAAFAARDAELSEQRRREQAKAAEAKQQSERARSLRALIAQHRMQDTLGEVSFHFVRRSGKVGRLALTPAIARLLEDGAAAVVEMPGETDPALLLSDIAKKAWAIDPRAIFFWAGPQKPIGFDSEADISESSAASGEPAVVAESTPTES